jgi:hypothetical protein
VKYLAALAAVFVVAQSAGQVVRPSTQQRPPTQDEFGQKEARVSGVPWPVLSAEKQWSGPGVLVPLLASQDANTRIAAVRAVGRLEDPRTVPAPATCRSPSRRRFTGSIRSTIRS